MTAAAIDKRDEGSFGNGACKALDSSPDLDRARASDGGRLMNGTRRGRSLRFLGREGWSRMRLRVFGMPVLRGWSSGVPLASQPPPGTT
jgi:hypothetical protein